MFKIFRDFALRYLQIEAKRQLLQSIIAASNSHKPGWEERAFVLSQTYRNINREG